MGQRRILLYPSASGRIPTDLRFTFKNCQCRTDRFISVQNISCHVHVNPIPKRSNHTRTDPHQSADRHGFGEVDLDVHNGGKESSLLKRMIRNLVNGGRQDAGSNEVLVASEAPIRREGGARTHAFPGVYIEPQTIWIGLTAAVAHRTVAYSCLARCWSARGTKNCHEFIERNRPIHTRKHSLRCD